MMDRRLVGKFWRGPFIDLFSGFGVLFLDFLFSVFDVVLFLQTMIGAIEHENLALQNDVKLKALLALAKEGFVLRDELVFEFLIELN